MCASNVEDLISDLDPKCQRFTLTRNDGGGHTKASASEARNHIARRGAKIGRPAFFWRPIWRIELASPA
jgi:hypothetical protein